MRSRSGKFFQPRFGAMTTMPRSRSNGPGAPTPMPMKSRCVAFACSMVSRMTLCTRPTIRSTTPSSPTPGLVGMLRIANWREPSAVSAPATMFVPPRSTPTMYCVRSALMGVNVGREGRLRYRPAESASTASATSDDDNPRVRPQQGRELRIIRPSFGGPHASRRERDERFPSSAEQRIDATTLCLTGEQGRLQLLSGWLAPVWTCEHEQPRGMVQILAVIHALRVEPPSRRRTEPESRRNARDECQRATAQRPLREKAGVVPLATQCPRDSDKASQAAVGTALVVDDERADRRMIREQRRGLRSSHHVHRSATRKLHEQWRREDDVSEKRRLDDERRRHAALRS